ncbi:MAG: 50S ribosomal protein L6 [Nanoarchaeota archaeon]
MKHRILEKVKIPEGISCTYSNKMLFCKKGSNEIKRLFDIPKTEVSLSDNEVIVSCSKGNQKDYKNIKSNIAHLNNLFQGLENKYSYVLEICNVHFPITIKVDKNMCLINNFLGEKNPRYAEITEGAQVEVKHPKIIVSSANIESAGQTAANLEKATKIRKRDRRIFQDGIFIVEKPGRIR